MADFDIAFDEEFLGRAARQFLDYFRSSAEVSNQADGGAGDYSSLRVVVPNLLLAGPLTAALVREAAAPILLPRIDTLSGFVTPWVAAQSPLPQARRQLLLHSGLKTHFQLEESSLWDLTAELTSLFDELTAQAVSLQLPPANIAGCWATTTCSRPQPSATCCA